MSFNYRPFCLVKNPVHDASRDGCSVSGGGGGQTSWKLTWRIITDSAGRPTVLASVRFNRRIGRFVASAVVADCRFHSSPKLSAASRVAASKLVRRAARRATKWRSGTSFVALIAVSPGCFCRRADASSPKIRQYTTKIRLQSSAVAFSLPAQVISFLQTSVSCFLDILVSCASLLIRKARPGRGVTRFIV